jgi:hypothetical protein
MEGKQSNLKPQDIIIIMKIISNKRSLWRVTDLAHELELSAGEISNALERLKTSKLISSDKKTPMIRNIKEFLFYGVKYAYPARIGKVDRGILTAHSFGELRQKIVSDEKYVWPCADGDIKGTSVSPLFKNAPQASLKDKELHEYLALIDSIRIGKVREQKLAIEILSSKLESYEL